MTDGPVPGDKGSTRPAPPIVPQLLLELVNNPLDPGYAAAARRRAAAGTPPPRSSRSVAAAAVAIGALVIGFVLVIAYDQTHRGAPEAKKVHDRLVTRVRDAQDSADDLARQAGSLESEVDALRASVLPQSGTLARRLQSEIQVAGLTKVDGPGLTVTLTDPKAADSTPAPGRAGTVPIGATTTLTDRDVRSVVNELWHDGAEAIAVNGVRLTPTSAIRFAGEAVLVDFQPITSPYRIEAIGNRDGLSVAFAGSDVASRYQTLEGVEGIGFSFADSGSLHLPAGTSSTLRYAKAVTGAPAKAGR
jgi:uncharacterized protein YlxW (UPF0749 family)